MEAMVGRSQIAALILMSSSLLLFGAVVTHELRAKERQVVCHSRLSHWGTAFHLYHYRQGKQWQLAPGHDREKWMETVRSYLYSPDVEYCPGIEREHGIYSYKINGEIVPAPRAAFGNFFPPNTTLLFDGACDSNPVAANDPPYFQVANRHLGGANLLLLDGSVVYRRAHAEGIATGEIGWRDAGGLRWSFR